MNNPVILNNLNAFGVLENIQMPRNWLCYGPKAIQTGVVVWVRPAGYHHYKMLDLFGIWAEGETVIIGMRTLHYTAAFYNPESYFKHIRRGFEMYYGKDASAPQEALYRATYDPARRLAMRQEVETIVQAWVSQH